MIYQLVANDKLLQAADNVYELDYSLIHHCQRWSIGIIYNDIVRVIAEVSWSPAAKYFILLTGRGVVDTISCHSMIIPAVKIALAVWNWEGRFVNENDTSKITIKPYEG